MIDNIVESCTSITCIHALGLDVVILILGMADIPNVVGAAEPEVEEVVGGAQANGAGGPGRLTWTNIMSGFILHRFSDLVVEGLKTDKGFKEVHLNQVARQLVEFCNVKVIGTQVYNHLRKWRQRWQKISRIKDISGAIWEEDCFVISMDDDHYNGHIKVLAVIPPSVFCCCIFHTYPNFCLFLQDHPKDAEFFNTPLINYLPMQNIFGSGVAIGRFAMGSIEALGEPQDHETIDVDAEAPKTPMGTQGGPAFDGNAKGEASTSGKRKRGLSEEEGQMYGGLIKSVDILASAIRAGTPWIYRAVMDVPDFCKEA
jgi:hypothetical protein